MKNYYIYILKCSDNSYYVGVTNCLDRRISEHQNSEFVCYTSARLPVKLVYYEEFHDIKLAIAAEKQIKGWSRAKKESLIKGEFELLGKLAECKNDSHYKNNNGLE